MKKTDTNLYLLYMLFGVVLVTANCIASKVWDTGIPFFGGTITLTVGTISYPFTFLITDVIGELWGKEKASLAVKYGFISQLCATGLIIAARYFPAVDSNVQNAYVTLLGQQWVFVLASMTGYLCSQSWDVMMFHKIREDYIRKHGTIKGGKWIWNNCSTITSQILDSVIYVTIAFGFGFGWIYNREMWPVMLSMMFGQWCFKAIIAICDTPFFYLLTKDSTAKYCSE